MAFKSTHELAQWFGYSGLIPFVILTLVIMSGMGYADPARLLFDWYSAVILAFMAGVYWPLAIREEGPVNPKRLMSASIIIALWSWFALILPETGRAVAFAVGYIFLYGVDSYVLDDLWTTLYLLMRSHLTLVVVACQLAVALFG
jgi:hypothetical protein